MSAIRKALEAALAKPITDLEDGGPGVEEFDPWQDIMRGIHGSYAAQSDDLAVGALIAIRDRKTFEFIGERGFAGEFMLYVLSGFGLLEYGTSPRGGWPNPAVADLWDALIDKWIAYADQAWGAGNWRR